MRRNVGFAALGAVLFALTLGVTTEAQRGGYGNTDSITAEELKVYDYFLASDQMEGRNVPSRGYDAAALYVASHLKEWGLKPGGSTTGTNGPLQAYFIPIELVSNQLDPSGMKLSVAAPPPPAGRGGRGGPVAAGPRSFDYGRDWTLGGGGGRGGAAPEAVDVAGAQMVFVGHGYVINKTKVNPYQGLDVKGKVVVVAGLPPELAALRNAAPAGRGGGGGAAPQNPLGVENTDYTTPQTYAATNGARAIVMVPTFQQLAAMTGDGGGRGAGPNGPPYQVVKFQANRPPAVPVVTAGVALTNALFQGEKLGGAQVFDGATANAKLDSFAFNAEKKLSLKTAVTSLKGSTENVIGIVEGGDPVLKNEYVVFSAHLDHVGISGNPDQSGDAISNGADDDGSGSAALLALARSYAQGAAKGIKPKRTMIFLWVAGEEKGLWGSQYFNQFPPVDITKVVANLNLDMIGRSKPAGYVDPPQYKLVEPGEVFVVGPDISSTDLGTIVTQVATSYKVRLNHFYDTTAPDATHDNLGPQPNGQRIFYRSDHYNFAKMGIPIAFFTTGLHTDYHRVTDSPEKIDFDHMLAITKTVGASGWVLANAKTRPALNAKLPERLVTDMKAAKDNGWGKLTPVLAPLPGMPF